MKRRGLTLILTFAIAFCVALPTQADNQTDALPDDLDVALNSVSTGDYAKYVAENTDFLGKGAAFTLNAQDYASSDGMELIAADGLQLKSEEGSVSWNVDVAVSGMYNLEIEYKPLGDSADAVEFAIAIDGQVPFEESKSLFLPRNWENEGDIRHDNEGNEFAATVKQADGFYKIYVFDPSGFNNDPLAFFLSAGKHTLTVELARAAMADKDYTVAMKYAKQGVDRGIYDQSYEYVRNDFLEKNIYLIIVGALLIIAIVIVFVIMKKRGKIPAINAPKLKIALSTSIHPFNNFGEIKYSNKGSTIIAAVFLVIYYIAVVMYDLYRGFAFSDFNVDDYNSLLTLLGSVGVVVLWIVCNWLVAVLAEGKGRIKEIFIVTCYSLLPLIISNLFCLAASNVLLLKEGTVLTIVSTCGILLTGIMLCIGTMKIHEFDFFKFLWTTIITIIAMALVIFLCFMIVILLQQFFAFIKTVFIEVTYR